MPARLALGTLLAAAIFACTKTAESAPAIPAAGAPGAAAFGPDSMPLVMDTALLRAADIGRIAGDSAAKVVVLEISDFQCPYCKTFHDSTYARIRSEYIDNGKARIAYVNLPLRNHANAWPAAEAAMCASVQKQFWSMHDSLFNAQPRWENIRRADTMFTRFATSLKLDATKYSACIATHATRPLIQSDAERANSAGVSATPTFIIGDSVLAGAYPFPEFKRIIDANLVSRGVR
jgi:protein-disulfide isomerase